MKLKKTMILLILSLFLLTGCNQIGEDRSYKITSPMNNSLPIQGKWIFTAFQENQEKDTANFAKDSLLGITLELSGDKALINNELYENIEYKSKNVELQKFFLYNYNKDIESLPIKKNNVDIISLTTQGKLLYNFIKLDEDTFLVFFNDIFYKLIRVDMLDNGSTLDTTINKIKENTEVIKNKKDSTIISGILLGLRSTIKEKDKKNGVDIEKIKYRTIWIEAENQIPGNILETEDLIVPRKSGFWKLGINRALSGSKILDTLYASGIDKNSEAINTENNKPRKITFVGNDYVVSEYSNEADIGSINYNRLEVLPIDNINKRGGIKISDILSERGKNILINSSQAFLTSKNKEEAEKFEAVPSESSFNLVRKSGHWVMNGRLFDITNEQGGNYKDFTIGILPPNNMVSYDKLNISWNKIKEKIPDAIDVFTSPNEDIAIVVTKSYIFVYGIESGKLSERFIKKINLLEGESIVMAEWATSDFFVERWEKTVLYTKGKPIKE